MLFFYFNSKNNITLIVCKYLNFKQIQLKQLNFAIATNKKTMIMIELSDYFIIIVFL